MSDIKWVSVCVTFSVDVEVTGAKDNEHAERAGLEAAQDRYFGAEDMYVIQVSDSQPAGGHAPVLYTTVGEEEEDANG